MTAAQFKKQVRFAAAKALTEGAFAARRSLAESMTEAFQLRNQYSQRGLRVVKANRTTLTAEAGQSREYLLDQVEGGRRTRAAIPFQRVRKRKRIPRSQWPGTQLAKGRTFITRSKRGGGRVVVKRIGKRRLRYQWVLPDAAQRVQPRWRFGDIAAKAGIPAVAKAFPQQLARALRTAR